LEGKQGPVIPDAAIAVFTDGSREPRETGVQIFFNGLLEDLYIPLGMYASVFQVDACNIAVCIFTENNRID